MARERCPYPDRFGLMYKTTTFMRGRGYVDQWVECEALKDNGWYRFYRRSWDATHTRSTLGSMVGTPVRWRDLQRLLEGGDKIAMVPTVDENDEVPDFADIL